MEEVKTLTKLKMNFKLLTKIILLFSVKSIIYPGMLEIIDMV
jgi:hypothetical protein